VRSWQHGVIPRMGNGNIIVRRLGVFGGLYAGRFLRGQRAEVEYHVYGHKDRGKVYKSHILHNGGIKEFSGLRPRSLLPYHTQFIFSSFRFTRERTPYSVKNSEILALQMGNQTTISSNSTSRTFATRSSSQSTSLASTVML
jgi:hypothetical protein